MNPRKCGKSTWGNNLSQMKWKQGDKPHDFRQSKRSASMVGKEVLETNPETHLVAGVQEGFFERLKTIWETNTLECLSVRSGDVEGGLLKFKILLLSDSSI
eukprot:6186078-Amphidinium_carterae.1